MIRAGDTVCLPPDRRGRLVLAVDAGLALVDGLTGPRYRADLRRVSRATDAEHVEAARRPGLWTTSHYWRCAVCRLSALEDRLEEARRHGLLERVAAIERDCEYLRWQVAHERGAA